MPAYGGGFSGMPAPRTPAYGGGFSGRPAPRTPSIRAPWPVTPGSLGDRPMPSGEEGIARPVSFKKGGKVKKTGWAKVHKGERVIPANAAGRTMGGKKKKAPKTKRAKAKIKKTMDEWKSGTLHSGSKKGPVVKNQKQAVAIAISQARRKT